MNIIADKKHFLLLHVLHVLQMIPVLRFQHMTKLVL